MSPIFLMSKNLCVFNSGEFSIEWLYYKCLLITPSMLGLSGNTACSCSTQKSTLVLFPSLFSFLASLACNDKEVP